MSTITSEMVVKCVNVRRTYGTGETEVHVLRNLNLEIEKGKLVPGVEK